MEEKKLQSAILKYRHLNHDRKSAGGPAAAVPAAETAGPKKRRTFTYTDHSEMLGQLCNNLSSAASPGNKLNGVYPTAALLRSSTASPSDGFQFEEAFQRGMRLVEKKDYKRALSEFTEAINVAPNKLKAYVQRAMCFMKAQRYDPAIEDYSKIIGQTPGDSDMFTKRAYAYECNKKLDLAIKDYTSAIDISTVPAKIKDARLARGKALAAMDHLTAALADFGAVIDMDRRSEEGYRQRALVYGRLEKHDLALADHDRVLELESRQLTHVKVESLLQRATTLLKLADSDEKGFLLHMQEDSALLSAEAGDRPQRHNARTICRALDDGRLVPCVSADAKAFAARAVDDFSAALEQDTDSSPVLAARGEALLRVGRFAEALRDLDAALAIDGREPQLLLARAVALQYLDNPDDGLSPRALELLATVVEKSPPRAKADAYFRRARLFIEHDRIEDAVADLTSVVQLFPKVLVEEKDTGADFLPEEQVKPFSLVGAKDAKTPVLVVIAALLGRARLHMQLSRFGAAVADYGAILSVAPGHFEAQLEEQQARDLDEKSKVEAMNRAYEWLMEHEKEAAKKAAKKKKKKAPKAAQDSPSKRPAAVPPRPPAIVVTVKADSASDNDDDDSDRTVVVQPSAPKSSPAPSRSATPNGRPVAYTRDEACESLYEMEAETPVERRVPPRPTFRFSLTDELPAPSAAKDDDLKSGGSDDDAKSRTSSTPAASPVVIVDDRYLRKRRKQLEKLRADLTDVCDRREADGIVEALDRATRKQMLEQLQDECQRAKALLAELEREKETAVLSPQRPTPTTSSDASPVPARTPDRSPGKPPVALAPPPIKTSASPPRPTRAESSPHRPAREASPDDVARLRYQLEVMGRALQEKQAELEQLKRLTMLAPAASPLPLSSLSNKLHCMERCMRPLAPAAFATPALRHADLMVELFGPTVDSERVRTKLMRYLAAVLEPVGAVTTFYPSGSYPLKTYLPDSDIDVCLVLADESYVATWHAAVTQALMAAATADVKEECAVRNVTFVNAEVRVVKCTIDNVSIDVTANRFGALGAVSLLHEMDARVGQHHLFKRSLILIKTWCMYDSGRFIAAPPTAPRSNVLGAVVGALSTFALNTMVLCLFNCFGKRICHPLQALVEFFHFYADFSWAHHAVTMFGKVPIASLNTGWRPSVRSADVFMDEVAVDAFRARVETVHGGVRPSLPFQVRACNVVDPLNECNNVARSVTADKLAELRQALQNGRQALVQIFAEAFQAATGGKKDVDMHAEDIVAALDPRALESFFLTGWQTYGSGYRPDLLVHPRQVWHPPAMNPFGDGNVAIDVLASQVADLGQLP
ncbi:hypothetical protein ACHHYP_13571 [Achlya hypogyna]|uniref:Polynucleotide adenylyltransferase n=1 Tax=Achlya hypogyna TaxID=1202772 RepID=A0A1V9YF28_ACHHY|nr:hypothetical protein ACHHYP_13571 [Achlya hypogyna]